MGQEGPLDADDHMLVPEETKPPSGQRPGARFSLA